MQPKSIFASKMFWFNALAFVVAVSGAYGYTGELGESLQPFVLPAIAVINLVLRYLTKQPVKLG